MVPDSMSWELSDSSVLGFPVKEQQKSGYMGEEDNEYYYMYAQELMQAKDIHYTVLLFPMQKAGRK